MRRHSEQYSSPIPPKRRNVSTWPSKLHSSSSPERDRPLPTEPQPLPLLDKPSTPTPRLSQYTIGHILGHGSFGVVKRALDPKGMPVALKQLEKSHVPEHAFDKEVTLLKIVGTHRNVCGLIEHFITPLQCVTPLHPARLTAPAAHLFDRAHVSRQFALYLDHEQHASPWCHEHGTQSSILAAVLTCLCSPRSQLGAGP
eukprot:scaffold19736_cov28-Tisochrysis_lutea.AAC.5